MDVNNVQNVRDDFEIKIVKIIDKIVPLTEFNIQMINLPTPSYIKSKLNKRKKLLKQLKKRPSNEIERKLNSLNAEIKTFYFTQKRNSVRKYILPGNSRSLWSAVNIKLMRILRKYTWTA